MHNVTVEAVPAGCILVRQWQNGEERIDLFLAEEGKSITSVFVLKGGDILAASFSLQDTPPDIIDGHTYYSQEGRAETRSAWKSSLMHRTLLNALEDADSLEVACNVLKALRDIFPEERRGKLLAKTQTT